jgi:hypothetical protein
MLMGCGLACVRTIIFATRILNTHMCSTVASLRGVWTLTREDGDTVRGQFTALLPSSVGDIQRDGLIAYTGGVDEWEATDDAGAAASATTWNLMHAHLRLRAEQTLRVSVARGVCIQVVMSYAACLFGMLMGESERGESPHTCQVPVNIPRRDGVEGNWECSLTFTIGGHGGADVVSSYGADLHQSRTYIARTLGTDAFCETGTLLFSESDSEVHEDSRQLHLQSTCTTASAPASESAQRPQTVPPAPVQEQEQQQQQQQQEQIHPPQPLAQQKTAPPLPPLVLCALL